MLIWGRNNNHLFRHNHKKTYSVPQKIPLNKHIIKCATGYDYILILAKQPHKLYCYYENALYQLNTASKVVDVETTDNMIVFVYQDGKACITQFNSQKIKNSELNLSPIHIKQKLNRVFMSYGDIFLQGDSNIYHLKRNEWYETKTYSDPKQIQGLQKVNISYIVPALSYNYFLTQQGKVYSSNKKDPHLVHFSGIKQTFSQISAADYFVGIAKNGRLYILGTYQNTNYDTLTQFGKIAQKFKRVKLSNENGFAITEKGQAWVWGKNANGQLGISDYEPRPKPFPLITMQNQAILSFYLGEGYTICLAKEHSSQKQSNKPRRITFQNQELSHDQNIQFSLQIPRKVVKTSNLSIQNISNIKINDTKKENKSKDKQNWHKEYRTQHLKPQNADGKIKNDKSPQKAHSKSRSSVKAKSISPSIIDKYSKSPYLSHFRQRSLSNISNKKAIKEVREKQSSKSVNQHKANLQEKEKQEFSNMNKRLLQQNSVLLEQNNKFRKIIELKQMIIQQITGKIQLLQEAIEQHEVNLTSRDHILQEHQQRQKEYLIQIDELQKSIQLIIQAKTQSYPAQNKFTQCYQSIKEQFQKEKDYYVKKVKEYEELLLKERTFYKQIIHQLEDQILIVRNQGRQCKNIKINQNKVQRQEVFIERKSIQMERKVLGDRTSKQNIQNLAKQKKDDQNQMKMDLIISRIQDSKVRIQKSVTKLNELFD